jgi:translation initiation factor IF-2
MAGEFGISADEVIALLRQMEVPVRSHLSLLTDDQVSRVRARWEREKRIRAEKAQAPAPAAPRRRRTGAAAEAAAPEPATPPAEAPASAVRRRRRADVEAAAAAAEEAAAVAVPSDAVEVQPRGEPSPAPVAEAVTAAPETVAPETPPPVAAAPVAPETAIPAAPPAPAVAPTSMPTTAPTPVVSAAPPVAPPPAPAALPPDRPRPRPVVPGAPRPAFGTARPIASAAPGGGLNQGQRRDDRDRRPGGGSGLGAPAAPGGAAAQRRGKKGKRGAVDQEAVSANITRTMTAMRGAPTRRGGRRFGADLRAELEEQRVAAAERERKTVRVNEFITVSELAQILGVPATQIVGFAFKTLGLMVTINQRLDFDQIELIAGEFGFQAVKESEYAAEVAESEEEDRPEDLRPRPPVVTIMGHVDHGKTSLLDYIRKANVVAGEAGGITQHIGAYHVEVPGGRTITFLDTPGHEAFTAMRARGAQVTDIVVLVVAADDQVMPQTVEAISHAKSAGVPIIVAINKIDLPTANVAKVKQDLLQHDVVLEEFGGTVLHSEISAKKGTGVPDLLEQILLQADILELKANPSRKAVGSVIEAQLDHGKGPVATVLVANGTLRVGDDFICGIHSGRVRAMLDERGKPVKAAGPAIPVQILGLTGVPMAGDQLIVVEDATAAREIAQRRERLDREAKSRRTTRGMVSLEDFMSQAAAGQKRQLRLVIKADQGGPAEALADALGQLSNPEVTVEIIHRGVGAITESDILLAKASGAIIVGFHVRPDNNARAAAEREGVDIKLYRIIYEAVADVKAALEGMLRPEEREVVYGEAEVRETFKVARVGTIAGCIVRTGVINRKGRVRVVRDGVELYDGAIASLRRFKDDVTEVKEGYECGIGIENFNDLKVGDVLECYRTEEVARTLDQAARG